MPAATHVWRRASALLSWVKMIVIQQAIRECQETLEGSRFRKGFYIESFLHVSIIT